MTTNAPVRHPEWMVWDTATLLPCPCGRPLTELRISNGGGSKYAWVNGDCCGDWSIEFRTGYYDLNSPECMELAIKAWNQAVRGQPA